VLNNLVSREGKKEWRSNWPVVAVSMVGFAVAQIHLYSIGAMIAPLEKEFHWSRVQISSGLFILSMIASTLSPFMGMMVDRLGPRRIALSGVLFYCGGIAALSLAQQPIWTWWGLWVLLACAQLWLNPAVWVTAVSSLFEASRGLALALATCSTGLVALVAPLLSYFLIENFGWRMAYKVWGAAAAAIALPLIYFFFTSARDTKRTQGEQATVAAALLTRPSLRASLLSRAFLKLAIAALIMSIMTMSLSVNMIPLLTSLHIDAKISAEIAGLIGLTQILGRLSGGFLLDRMNARIVGGAAVLLPTISAIILKLSGGSVPLAMLAVMIFGLSVGAEMDVIAYLTARFFRIEIFGTIFGIIVGLLAAGNGIGPLLGNWIYDLTGSYTLVLWAVIPMSMAGSALLLTLGAYPQSHSRTHRELAEAQVAS
jgi:MFS family permease